MSRAARFGRFALLFSGGVMLAAAVPRLPSAGALAGIALAGAGLAIRRSTRPLAGLPLGLVWFLGHAALLEAERWPPERAGETMTFEARVVGLPGQRDGRARIEVVTDDPELPGRMLLGWYRPLEFFRPGERWRLTAALDPPDGRFNPAGFDYLRYLVARGIGATGSIRAAERIAPGDAGAAADRFRQRFSDWLQGQIANLDAAALARALTVADRSAMSPELDAMLRRTGTAHLLSISGLHVGMVAGLAGLAFALVITPLAPALNVPDRRRASIYAGLAAAAGYAALAGFSLPTLRALVMLVVGLGALLLRRRLQPGRALVMALLGVVLIDPLAPLAIGFWLSFGAVAVLIWAFAGRAGAGQRGWRGLVRAQLVIALGLLPLNIGIFGQWAPTALLANLLAIPLVGLWVLPALLVTLFGFWAGLPTGWAVGLTETGLVVLLKILDAAAALDSALPGLGQPARPAPGLAGLLIAMLGGLWLLAPRGWPLRPAGLVLLLPLLWPARSVPAPGGFELLVADVGDGHAVLVRTRAHALLFGTGPGDGEQRALIDTTLAPLLRQAGVRAPDWIVAPLEQRDYAGGLAEARRQWPRARVFESAAGAPARCRAGHDWSVDGVTFRFLHPGPALPDLGRASGCVLEIRSAAGAALLTGGVTADVLARLRTLDRVRPVDVVVLPARGHRDALDAEWLARLDPRLAVATAARANRFGLPHPEVRNALRELGIRLATTGACGAISVGFAPDRAPAVEADLIGRPRFWRTGRDCVIGR